MCDSSSFVLYSKSIISIVHNNDISTSQCGEVTINEEGGGGGNTPKYQSDHLEHT
jgi:hypothetical protein